MAYNEILAERVREIIRRTEGYSERKMFGGICFMIHGNMAAGVTGEKLMLRVGKERAEELMQEEGVKEMDLTGRPMKGMVWVMPEYTAGDEDLVRYVANGVDYASSLPPKKKK